MSNNNIKFNSRYGIDLGSIDNITISGSKTLQEKVIVLRKNPNTGEYYLEPQDIGIQHGINDTTLTLKDNDTNYIKSFVFSNFSEDIEKKLVSMQVDLSGKTTGIISISGKLFARETNEKNEYNNYSFITGSSIPFKYLGSELTMNRNIYNKFTFLYVNGVLKDTNDSMYSNYQKLNDALYNKKYLEPSFSTIGNEGLVMERNNLPFILLDWNTDDILEINILCNKFKTDTKLIEWFGNFDITVAAT